MSRDNPSALRSRVLRAVPKELRNRIGSYLYNRSTPVYDIDYLCHRSEVPGGTKRALVSYVTTPFRIPASHPLNMHFSNIGIARSIVYALNELGYIADVVEWSDTKFLPRRKYDVFLGHGGINYERIARALPPHVTKIYFSTGLYWREHNEREENRFGQLQARRGIRLPYDRWISHNEEYANENANGIICIGGQVSRESYSRFPLVITINNAAFDDNHYNQGKKDFATGIDKFVFFAGAGNVHKGLDLLLEAFAQVRAHVYVCQEIRPDFYEVYRNELSNYANIHLLGHIPLRGSQFYELMDKCNFAILPSCAEGQPGSLVECMHQGLIPVVSREANVDVDGYGITLDLCSISGIIEVVNDLSKRAPQWCREMSLRTRKTASADYSQTSFRKNIRTALERVLLENR